MIFVKSSKKTFSNFLFQFSPFYRTFWQILHSWISVQSLWQNGIKKDSLKIINLYHHQTPQKENPNNETWPHAKKGVRHGLTFHTHNEFIVYFFIFKNLSKKVPIVWICYILFLDESSFVFSCTTLKQSWTLLIRIDITIHFQLLFSS